MSLHANQVRFVNLLLARSFAGRHYRYTGALYTGVHRICTGGQEERQQLLVLMGTDDT